MTCWILRFLDYEYDLKYKKGKLNVNADALERYPHEKEINENLPKLRVLVLEKSPRTLRVKDRTRQGLMH